MWEVVPLLLQAPGPGGWWGWGAAGPAGRRVYLPRDVERCRLVLKEAGLVKQGQSRVLVVWVRHVGTRLCRGVEGVMVRVRVVVVRCGGG